MAGITYPLGDSSIRMDAFYSATMELLHKKGMFADNYFTAAPGFAHLREKGRVKTIADGGAKIGVNLMYAGNSTVGSVGEYEEIDISPVDGGTRAYFDWAEYSGAITISNREKAANRSKPKIVDLLAFKAKQLGMTFGERGSQHLYDAEGITVGAASTTGNGGKNMIGLPILANYLGGSSADGIGGIDGNSYTWWQATVKDYGATNTNVWLSNKLNELYVELQTGGPGGPPDFGLCDVTTWTKIVAALDVKKQLVTSDEKMASLGFHNVKYLNCTLYPDPYMSDPEAGLNYNNSPTAGCLYMLKSDSLTFYMMSGRDFKPGPFRPAPKQLASTAIAEAQMQLTTNNRRNLGVMYGITKAAAT